MKTEVRIGQKTGFEKFVDVVDGFIDRHPKFVKNAGRIGLAYLALTTVDYAISAPSYGTRTQQIMVRSGQTFDGITKDLSKECPGSDFGNFRTDAIRTEVEQENHMDAGADTLDEGQKLTLPAGPCHVDNPFDVFGLLSRI